MLSSCLRIERIDLQWSVTALFNKNLGFFCVGTHSRIRSKSEEEGSDFGFLIGSAWHWDELCLEVVRSLLLEVYKHSKAKVLQ